MVAYDYEAQRWVTGPMAVKALRAEVAALCAKLGVSSAVQISASHPDPEMRDLRILQLRLESAEYVGD